MCRFIAALLGSIVMSITLAAAASEGARSNNAADNSANRVTSVMYGRPPPCKGFRDGAMVACGHVSGLCCDPVTAGLDGIRRSVAH